MSYDFFFFNVCIHARTPTQVEMRINKDEKKKKKKKQFITRLWNNLIFFPSSSFIRFTLHFNWSHTWFSTFFLGNLPHQCECLRMCVSLWRIKSKEEKERKQKKVLPRFEAYQHWLAPHIFVVLLKIDVQTIRFWCWCQHCMHITSHHACGLIGRA